MASRDQQRNRAIDRIAQHMLRTGLSQTSLRQLAGAAKTSDRMLLYYFSDKSEAVAEALTRIAGQMSAGLDAAIPIGTRLKSSALVARAADLTLGPKLKPFMALWIEIVAAAARREEPYAEIARRIAAGFLAWIEARLDAKPGPARTATAAMILAMVDGLALLDVCADTGLTHGAAAQMSKISLPPIA